MKWLRHSTRRINSFFLQINQGIFNSWLDKENKIFNFDRSSWHGDPRNASMTVSREATDIATAFSRDVKLNKYIKALEKRIQDLETKTCPPCLKINDIGIAPSGSCK